MSVAADVAIAQNELGAASRSLATATSILRVARQDLEHAEKHGAPVAKRDALREQIDSLEAETADVRKAVDKLG